MNVINLFGGPSSGKSTLAAGLFERMKKAGLNVELVTEYAKRKTWEGHFNILEDQIYILGKQNRMLEPLRGVVDWVITDSPLLLGLVYAHPNYYQSFRNLVWDVWNSYANHNVFLLRPAKESYSEIGRVQKYEDAVKVDDRIKRMLDANAVEYGSFFVFDGLADGLAETFVPKREVA